MKIQKMFMPIFIVALIASACAAPTAPATPLKVQLGWFHNIEFIGFYAAEQQGYYKEENLAVTLLEGSPDIDPTVKVLANEADFGITSGDNIIRSQAAKKDLIAVSSIFRQNPVVIMSLPNSNIKKPADLAGKKVGVISPKLDSTWDIQFLAMLKKMNVDPKSMTFIPIENYTGANELTSGRMQAMSGMFSTNEPVQAKIDGQNLDLIYYSDYGILIYANTIFTRTQITKQNPENVRRFVRATLKGYQYAIEHPKEAAKFVLKYDPKTNVALDEASMQIQIPLIDTGNAQIGTMDLQVWQSTHDILLEQKVISAPVDLKTVYTNEFLPKK